MARVIAPNSDFTGVRAGVAFSEGVGQTGNSNALAYFGRHGYTVEADAADLEEQEATWEETKNFQEATVAELRMYAEQNDIDLDGATKKAEIIAAIEAALEDEGSGDD